MKTMLAIFYGTDNGVVWSQVTCVDVEAFPTRIAKLWRKLKFLPVSALVDYSTNGQ